MIRQERTKAAMAELYAWFKELMAVPEQFWGEYAFWREPLKNKIKAEQRAEFIRKSVAAAGMKRQRSWKDMVMPVLQPCAENSD